MQNPCPPLHYREFFELLGEALVNPNYALFEEVGGRFRPNPNSGINPNHLFYFNFTGKVMAKAVADGEFTTVSVCAHMRTYVVWDVRITRAIINTRHCPHDRTHAHMQHACAHTCMHEYNQKCLIINLLSKDATNIIVDD